MPGCDAFTIPSIALYAIVAGGALFLVLTALFIALCIKHYKLRRSQPGDGNKGKKPLSKNKANTKGRDPEKGKGGKNAFSGGKKSKNKVNVTTAKVVDETKSSNNKKKEKNHKGAVPNEEKKKKDQEKKRLKDEKMKKKEEQKRLKVEQKKLKEEEKKKKQQQSQNKDKDKGKMGNNKNGTNKYGKGLEDSKAKSKWKNAVSKINTGKKTEVAPSKGGNGVTKLAWTIPVEKNEMKKKFSF